jgi:hypothetical protein
MGSAQSKTAQSVESKIATANSMAQQASNALICGPDCQQRNTEATLRQQYTDASTNIITAPAQLIQAEKNYYTFTGSHGGETYNTFLDGKYQKIADDLKIDINSNFGDEITAAIGLNNTYNTLYINYQNIQDRFDNLHQENIDIDNQIKLLASDMITNDRKSFYEMQGYENLSGWYKFFLWIYIILVVAFFIACFFVNSGYSNIRKFLILIALIIYPFVIHIIVLFLIKYGNILYSFIVPKNAHLHIRKSTH